MVQLEDLLSFDSDLPSLLRSSPSDYLPLFETAAGEVLASLKMKVAEDSGEMVEPPTGEVQILLASKEDPVSMRSLWAIVSNMLLSVDRHLVQTIVPATRLTIVGIYSIFQAANSSTNHKGAVAVRQPYIRIVGMEETSEASS